MLALAWLNGGTLRFNRQAQVAAVASDLEAVAGRANALESLATALRTRLDALEMVATRITRVESQLAHTGAVVAGLEAEARALSAQAARAQAQANVIEAASQRFGAFLAGLRDLLISTAPGDPDGPFEPAGGATAPPSGIEAPARVPAAKAPPAP
jgi:prefoldin subunit 5